jgi:hypothetical protein
LKPKTWWKDKKSSEIAAKVGSLLYFPSQNEQNIASDIVIKQVFNTVVLP